MIKLYDTVIIKKTGKKAAVIEIDNKRNTIPNMYLVEILDDEKPEEFDLNEVVFWCEYSEIERLS